MKFVIAGLIGYLLGSVNSALIIGKILGVDIRNHGSKNAGMTNALRVFGKKKALFVLLGDVLKGVIACLIGKALSNGESAVMLTAGLLCIIGHNWPVYFGFKGGKGALTSITVLFFADYRIAFILLATFIILVAITGFVSLGSIVSAIILPIMGIVFDKGIMFLIFSLILAFMLIYRHRANIGRLMRGEESKLNFKKAI